MWNAQYQPHLEFAAQALAFLSARARTKISFVKLTIKSSKSVEGTQPCWESREVRDTAQLSQDRTKISRSLALPPEASLPDSVFSRSVCLKSPAELWVTTNSSHREKATNEGSWFSHKHNLFHVVTFWSNVCTV